MDTADADAFSRSMAALVAELEKLKTYRGWWALNNPIAYVWLCRAERRGAVIPWWR